MVLAAFFFHLLPLPVETPAKAADSRDSAQRGGALCVLRRQPCQHSGKRPVAYLPAGRHFFKEYPHAPR